MQEGLQLSLYGVGITFLTLGALILLIRALVWLGGSETPSAPQGEAEPSEAEHTAAIAAAWWYLNQQTRGQLGQRLTEKPGPWWKQQP